MSFFFFFFPPRERVWKSRKVGRRRGVTLIGAGGGQSNPVDVFTDH